MTVLFFLSCLFFAFWPCAFLPVPVAAATVAAVLDGDTIQLSDGTTVRYLGVNTPEHGQPFAEEAKRFNEQLVLGEEVRLETTGKKHDAYRRVLAYVSINDVLVNAELIVQGLGHLFVIGSFDRYPEWVQLQRDAQARRVGMWSPNGVSGPLKITTLRADAEGDDRYNLNGEYVRICNVSTELVELRGFSIRDGSHHRYVFPAGRLKPGYTALLLSGRGYQQARRHQLLFYWGSARPIWNNGGDTAWLFDPNGKLIDSFHVQP